MKKSSFRILMVICLLIVIILGMLPFLLNSNERFRIKDLKYTVFQYDNFDTSECLKLYNYSKDTIHKSYVLGIRMDIEWYSESIEDFSQIFRDFEIDNGHSDSIRAIHLFDLHKKNQEANLTPMMIKKFLVTDTLIENHSISHPENCNITKPGMTIKDFINFYNSSDFRHPQLTDYFLFKIDSIQAYQFYTGLISLKLETN